MQKNFWKIECTIYLFILFLLRTKKRERMRQDYYTQILLFSGLDRARAGTGGWCGRAGEEPTHHSLDLLGGRKDQVRLGSALRKHWANTPSGPSASIPGLLEWTDHRDKYSSYQRAEQLGHH